MEEGRVPQRAYKHDQFINAAFEIQFYSEKQQHLLHSNTAPDVYRGWRQRQTANDDNETVNADGNVRK